MVGTESKEEMTTTGTTVSGQECIDKMVLLDELMDSLKKKVFMFNYTMQNRRGDNYNDAENKGIYYSKGSIENSILMIRSELLQLRQLVNKLERVC